MTTDSAPVHERIANLHSDFRFRADAEMVSPRMAHSTMTCWSGRPLILSAGSGESYRRTSAAIPGRLLARHQVHSVARIPQAADERPASNMRTQAASPIATGH